MKSLILFFILTCTIFADINYGRFISIKPMDEQINTFPEMFYILKTSGGTFILENHKSERGHQTMIHICQKLNWGYYLKVTSTDLIVEQISIRHIDNIYIGNFSTGNYYDNKPIAITHLGNDGYIFINRNHKGKIRYVLWNIIVTISDVDINPNVKNWINRILNNDPDIRNDNHYLYITPVSDQSDHWEIYIGQTLIF